MYMPPLQVITLCGKVVSVIDRASANAGNFTNVSILSTVSRKKKPSDETYPANLYQLTIWKNSKNKTAYIANLKKGDFVLVVGDLGEARIYEKNGKPQVALAISQVHSISIMNNYPSKSADNRADSSVDMDSLLEDSADSSDSDLDLLF